MIPATAQAHDRNAAEPVVQAFRPTRATADGTARRKELCRCVNKEMEKENDARKGKGRHLTHEQLKKLERIVDDEIMKEPLKNYTEEEQKVILKKIEDAAKKDLKEVPTATIDKIMIELKEKAAHCASVMWSPSALPPSAATRLV
ncbi:hypothetical protein GCM10010211_29000 [Streptomyces albospinus]|uniref:Uncharacterized protein n=1 Tax=Streptomyces albospinus TaxID=285515 RepID=A0ABQ2V1X5_9ACTN|nr:hypothetical protein GCM10010211_29000 [Streptomyces albospinus]